VAAILVHIDLDGDRPHASSLVALAAGRHVASSWGGTLYAALIVHDPNERRSADSTGRLSTNTTSGVPGLDAIETALALAGADKVVVAVTDAKIAPLWAMVGGPWQGVLDHLRPRLVLFGADAPSAAELGARTAARIGARVLSRARSVGIDEVELRDKDGGYVRASDSGAAVVMVGRADLAPRGDDDVDLVVLALPGGNDARLELAGSATAELRQTPGVVIALGDDALEPKVVADAKKLAALLGAQLVGGPAALRAGVVSAGAVVERSTPLAPELCIAIGNAQLDLAGAASVVKIGGRGGKAFDGTLSGQPDVGLRELVRRLEGA
jgi:hypothetical protein